MLGGYTIVSEEIEPFEFNLVMSQMFILEFLTYSDLVVPRFEVYFTNLIKVGQYQLVIHQARRDRSP